MKILFAVLTSLALVVSGCQANPGPPPLASDDEVQAIQTTSTTPPPPRKPVYVPTIYSFGIDPLRGGFNPHLISDDSQFVQLLASLVLPSAFRDGSMDTDLLVSAALIDPAPGAAQTVRYEIQPEAQWSDGVPVTGRDFEYLWQAMTRTAASSDNVGYQRIQAVRTQRTGKIVDVDFSAPVADWKQLFKNILPSYLVGSPDEFATAFYKGIPASAGRFMISSIDRETGTITLNRNDRFWGKAPARIDSLIFTEIRNQAQGTQFLRSGQFASLDITPQETSELAYSLLPDVKLTSVTTGRKLRIIANAASPLVDSVDKRRELFSLIDIPTLARLAAGRSDNLLPGEASFPSVTDTSQLVERTKTKPLTIAVDPMNVEAKIAAQALVDMLSWKKVTAKLMETNLGRIARTGLPTGAADVVVVWENEPTSGLQVVSRYECPASANAFRSSNLSGFCDTAVQQELDNFVSQGVSSEEATEFAAELEAKQSLGVTIMNETRMVIKSATADSKTAIDALDAWAEGRFPQTDARKPSPSSLASGSSASPQPSTSARESIEKPGH